LEDAIVDRLKSFYLSGFDDNGLTYDEKKYANDVLDLDKKRRPLPASLIWLHENGAMAEADKMDFFNKIRTYRNQLAHEMLERLSEGIDIEEDTDRFQLMISLLKRLKIGGL